MPDYPDAQITFMVADKIYKSLSNRARAANSKPSDYAKALFAAAYASKVGVSTGDVDLDDAVAQLFQSARVTDGTLAPVWMEKSAPALLDGKTVSQWRQECRVVEATLAACQARDKAKAEKIERLEGESRGALESFNTISRKFKDLKHDAADWEARAISAEQSLAKHGAVRGKVDEVKEAKIEEVLTRCKELEAKNASLRSTLGGTTFSKNKAEKERDDAGAEIMRLRAELALAKAEPVAVVEDVAQTIADLRAELSQTNTEMQRALRDEKETGMGANRVIGDLNAEMQVLRAEIDRLRPLVSEGYRHAEQESIYQTDENGNVVCGDDGHPIPRLQGVVQATGIGKRSEAGFAKLFAQGIETSIEPEVELELPFPENYEQVKSKALKSAGYGSMEELREAARADGFVPYMEFSHQDRPAISSMRLGPKYFVTEMPADELSLSRVLASNVAEISKLQGEIDTLAAKLLAQAVPPPTQDSLISAIVVAWGSGFDTALIAQKTRVSEATIARIISAWNQAKNETGKPK